MGDRAAKGTRQCEAGVKVNALRGSLGGGGGRHGGVWWWWYRKQKHYGRARWGAVEVLSLGSEWRCRGVGVNALPRPAFER